MMNSRSIVSNMMAAAAVNWVRFLETWLKFPNNLTRLKVGYDETTGLYFTSGRNGIGYEVGELNWRRDVDKSTKRQALTTTVFYFLDSFPLFWCPSVSLHSQLRQSLFLVMRTIHEFPRQFFRTWCWFRVDVRVFSTAVEWMVLHWNPTRHDFYTWAFIESTSEWTSSPFNKNFSYSFNYDKKKRSLRRIFIDREAWIMASRNCVKRSRSTAVMFGKCTSLKIVHEFIHSSAFLTILTNCRLPLTYCCVLCGGRLKFLLLRWTSTSCSGHGSSVKVPCKLDWYGIADTY